MEHDGAPARVASMVCALLVTGGMLALFFSVVPFDPTPEVPPPSLLHRSSALVVRLIGDPAGQTSSLPIPPEPTPARKAHRGHTQPHATAASDSRHDEPIVVDEGNTAAQDAAFDEVRRQFGMRPIAHPHRRRPGEPLQLFGMDGSILIPDARVCYSSDSIVVDADGAPIPGGRMVKDVGGFTAQAPGHKSVSLLVGCPPDGLILHTVPLHS